MTPRIITAVAKTLKRSFRHSNEAALSAGPVIATPPHAAPWANDPTVKWVQRANLVR